MVTVEAYDHKMHVRKTIRTFSNTDINVARWDGMAFMFKFSKRLGLKVARYSFTVRG